jgi:hypothetical protein
MNFFEPLSGSWQRSSRVEQISRAVSKLFAAPRFLLAINIWERPPVWSCTIKQAFHCQCVSLPKPPTLQESPQPMERSMITRSAACSCGQLVLRIEGEPSRISMCHCLECQRRTGAVISNQARFSREQVTFAGKATEWIRTAESGNAMTFHFCPFCGSTVYWENEGFPGCVTVAIGNFADPNFPAPTIAVWEESRHPWVSLLPDTPPKRVAKQG